MKNPSPARDPLACLLLLLVPLLACPLLVSLASDAPPAFLVRAFATATPTPAPRVYLLPFRQVFALGQTQPLTRTTFWLYESGSDVFRLLGQQGAFAHLQTLDGKRSFWTATENVSPTPPAPAQHDFTGRGKTIRLASSVGYACLHEDVPPPVFSVCQPSPDFAAAQLVAKITAGTVTLYLVEVEGKHYFIPPEGVLASP